MIICRQKNGKNIYYCPSHSKKGHHHRVMYMSAERRFYCECEFKVYRKLRKSDECSHIRLLKDYLDNKPEMIEYDRKEEVDDLDV
jgi:hypothetical protein